MSWAVPDWSTGRTATRENFIHVLWWHGRRHGWVSSWWSQFRLLLHLPLLKTVAFSFRLFDWLFPSFFVLSLILSLEAKLNLLHSYMNVTWIRIPSETRVRWTRLGLNQMRDTRQGQGVVWGQLQETPQCLSSRDRSWLTVSAVRFIDFSGYWF